MSVLDESVASSFRFFGPSEKSEGLIVYSRPFLSVIFPYPEWRLVKQL